MKVLLMHRDRDFDLQQELPAHAPSLTQDLELETLFRAMALGDEFLLEVARKAVLSSLNDLDTILYRQDVLKDCLKNSSIVRNIYSIAVESIERQKKNHWLWGISSRYPSGILHGSVDVLQMFAGMLKRLRNIADEHAYKFHSEGFKAFFTMLKMELSDEYLATVQKHLTALKFPHGAFLSADLGIGNASNNHLLRKARDEGSWLARILGRSPPGYTFRLHPRDQAGPRILSEMQDRGINLVANAIGQSADHVLSFFVALRTELAFYIGCLNLHDRLVTMGEPICFPRPEPVGERRLRFRELYDVCLALTVGRRVVGNALNADRKSLMVITGPNTGGKSTFLRSLGLAQLMMQCGMFVGAESFDAELCTGLFTHYKREEDPTMKRGKFDEELSRMNDITDKLAPESMLLFNESFAATNEREGSEIARQVVCALLEKRIRVFFVTHLYEFARGFFDRKTEDAIFLRAERVADGTRTFKVVEGKPLETSYGDDLYNKIFGSGSQV